MVLVIEVGATQGRDLRTQEELTSASADTYRARIALVERLCSHDILILEGPPRLAEMTRAILSLSDMVLVR